MLILFINYRLICITNNLLKVTAWIPLIDANMKNGCIEVASGGHRAGKTVKHTCCSGGTWYVELEEEDMRRELGVDLEKDLVVCEVPYGGVLFMNNAIPHRSLENFSDIIRYLSTKMLKLCLMSFFYNVCFRKSSN